jgi:hypothetical protein
MYGPDLVLECPVCRCRLKVPARRGLGTYTCRQGHRFQHDFGGGRPSWPARHPRLAVMVVALVILLLLAVRQWAGHGFQLHTT